MNFMNLLNVYLYEDEVTGEWSAVLTQYCSDDKIEKNEMGGACSAYEGEERCIQGFGGETWTKETTWETQA